MPLPFLFIAAAAGTGLLGVGKGIKAGIDQMEARETNEYAEEIIEESKNRVNKIRENCGNSLDDLGKKKVNILDSSMKEFITEFEKINHVELSESAGLNELQKFVVDKVAFKELKDLQGMATSLASGVASGAMAGAITAFGAYGAVSCFGTASTGAAIAGLSGAAASNATLAFLGGGSLAAGGLGMAGGAAVLGGLVAGPALAVLGFVVGAKASKNLDEAYSNYAKAKEFQEEMRAAADVCIGIRKRADMFNRFLCRLQTVFDKLIFQMSNVIEYAGTDYRTYSESDKNCIACTMAVAGAIKAVLDTAILDEEGNLTEQSEYIVANTQKKISGLEI